jgi:hypothetical protein
MNLDEAQKKKVSGWIAEGLKLSDIQNRIHSELGLRPTYMDVRLLVDDLKLVPKDQETKPTSNVLQTPNAAPATAAPAPSLTPETHSAAPATAGAVSVAVDSVTRAGAMVSGKVTFSDGNKADWYIDQTGRLGLAPQQPGYRPPPSDVQQFQAALDAELSKMGY